MKQVWIAAKTVLVESKYLAVFVLVAVVVFSLIFLIQVKTVPGNDGHFQIALFGWKDWLILGIISILNALFITIEIYVYNLKKTVSKSGVLTSGLGTGSGVLASIFSTASCSLCVSAIFGFLGGNTVLFLVNNRIYIVFAAIALLLLSLFLSAKRFGNVCRICKIER